MLSKKRKTKYSIVQLIRFYITLIFYLKRKIIVIKSNYGFDLFSHYVMRVASDSRRKRDVRPQPGSRLPAEDQRRLEFRLPIIMEVQITITTTIIMLHRHLGFTTNSIIRRESRITRRGITNILSLTTPERLIMTPQPTRSCLGGLTSLTGPALSTILRCDEYYRFIDFSSKKGFSLGYHLA